MALFALQLISNKMIHLITTTKLPISLNISKNIQTEISQKFSDNSGGAPDEEQKNIIILKEKEVSKLDENKDRLSVKIKLENGALKTLDLVQVPTPDTKSTMEKIKLRRETYSMGNNDILSYSKEDVQFNNLKISENKNTTKKAILSTQSFCYGIPSAFGTWFRVSDTKKKIANKNYAAFHNCSSDSNEDSSESELPTLPDILKDLKPEEYDSNINKNYIKLESTDGFLNYKYHDYYE